mgnify:CR=1 FL=1
MTVSEALTLQMVEDSLRPLLPSFMLKSLEPRFAQTYQKLQALGPQVLAARWIDKIASVPQELTLQAPEIDEALLEWSRFSGRCSTTDNSAVTTSRPTATSIASWC